MAYEITKEDVWVGEIEDRAGAVAEKLEAVSRAGVDLEFLIARRAPERPLSGQRCRLVCRSGRQLLRFVWKDLIDPD